MANKGRETNSDEFKRTINRTANDNDVAGKIMSNLTECLVLDKRRED